MSVSGSTAPAAQNPGSAQTNNTSAVTARASGASAGTSGPRTDTSLDASLQGAGYSTGIPSAFSFPAARHVQPNPSLASVADCMPNQEIFFAPTGFLAMVESVSKGLVQPTLLQCILPNVRMLPPGQEQSPMVCVSLVHTATDGNLLCRTLVSRRRFVVSCRCTAHCRVHMFCDAPGNGHSFVRVVRLPACRHLSTMHDSSSSTATNRL